MQDELLQHIIDNMSLKPRALTHGNSTTRTKRLKLTLARFFNKYRHPHKNVE